MMGMASQLAEREDSVLCSDVRDKLFGPNEFSRRDLAALNVMRGRDNGVADYNTVNYLWWNKFFFYSFWWPLEWKCVKQADEVNILGNYTGCSGLICRVLTDETWTKYNKIKAKAHFSTLRVRIFTLVITDWLESLQKKFLICDKLRATKSSQENVFEPLLQSKGEGYNRHSENIRSFLRYEFTEIGWIEVWK